MKKVISIFMIVVLMFSLVACNSDNKSNNTANGDKTLDYPKRAIEIVVPFGAGGCKIMFQNQ